MNRITEYGESHEYIFGNHDTYCFLGSAYATINVIYTRQKHPGEKGASLITER